MSWTRHPNRSNDHPTVCDQDSVRICSLDINMNNIDEKLLLYCRCLETFSLYTVRRPVVKFYSTARMYMDQSLPGTESVFCFWPVLNPAPQCNFPMALENFIVEPFHGQEFSTNAHSQTWNFPLVLYINGIFDGVLSTECNFPFVFLSPNGVFPLNSAKYSCIQI